ncbi:Oidioi.mRNA.OKI2018_I69.PAR.g10484.t1.cds [Oikopleura dioica]|uniref:Oidioi.mRNA.OKI2018_I69.PAR.g10484.t1.cds n=1 Tax=Oikopleura dioica TaxID=34765 RepID=A0ABN7RQQ9_OIKDI|nr:Oidioi.mRNA.OKI2018_I69.PAR.g10484.t1.cds [Oikopleura dioica]
MKLISMMVNLFCSISAAHAGFNDVFTLSSLKTRLCNRLTSPEARLDAGCELKESKLGPDSSKSIDLTKSLSGLVNDFQSVPLMLKRFI